MAMLDREKRKRMMNPVRVNKTIQREDTKRGWLNSTYKFIK
jgi:hypothetical protein